jgi:hypothetical protein
MAGAIWWLLPVLARVKRHAFAIPHPNNQGRPEAVRTIAVVDAQRGGDLLV